MNLDDLNLLLRRASARDGAPLYRRLLGLADEPYASVRSMDEWRTLPFLTKRVLLETPLSERTFAGRYDVDHLRASSGTSGKPPVFSPRTHLRAMGYRMAHHDFRGALLAYTVPAMPHWHERFQEQAGQPPSVIVYDPLRPAASARLAARAGVSGISTFAYHLRTIGEHLTREGVAADIRLIELCGESCSHALYEYLRDTFPNATLLPFYGATEVEDSPIGVPCRPITGEMPLSVYHAKEGRYHELIDPSSGKALEPRSGVEGELVISAYPGEPSAFPLIRYRTGDMVRIVDECCDVHGGWSFTVLGRQELDFLKIEGGTLRADEAERVARALRLGPDFELHYFDAQGVLPRLELHAEAPADGDSARLLREFAEKFRVSEQRTYADLVREGSHAPLSFAPLTKKGAGKAKRLIKH